MNLRRRPGSQCPRYLIIICKYLKKKMRKKSCNLKHSNREYLTHTLIVYKPEIPCARLSKSCYGLSNK